MRVCADVGIVPMEGDYGEIDGTEAICKRCGNCTGSFGISSRSERRSLVMLRESCPNGESNVYVSCA